MIDMFSMLGVIDMTFILTPYGFMLYVLSMIASIANRFSNYKDFLEIEVSNRTRQLEQVNTQLETLATTDMLTGLLNRHAMNAKVLRHERDQIDNPNSFIVIVMDIDHFKSINDAYGHTVGDDVLAKFGELIRAVVKAPNIASRWGGEEFVILLPGVELAQGQQMAEMLRLRISGTTFHSRMRSLVMTATFGVAQGEGKQSFQSVLELADRAMYQGKGSGRNKVVTG